VVNTEKLGTDNSRLHFAIAKAVGPLLHDLGEKLVADAALETLEKLNRVTSNVESQNPAELLEGIDAATASTLASDVATAAGVHLLAADLHDVEQSLGSLLATRARSHMNTLERIPHIATEAAQFLIALENASLTRSAGAKCFAETLAQIKQAWDEKEHTIQRMEHVSLADFQTFRTEKLDRAFGFALQNIVTACAGMQAIAAEGVFPMRELIERTRNPAAAMPTIAAFTARGTDHKKLLAHLDTARTSSSLRHARHHIARGQWVKALEHTCESVLLLSKIVEAMRLTEPSPSLDPRQNRYLEGENFLYVKTLSRQLMITGAAPRDVEKLADSLYEYGCKNNAACAELIDEEILKLNPNLRREALAKSRLEVRLSEKTFPLSANHKEWIVQTTRAFLKE
jgi:hypothetical protein